MRRGPGPLAGPSVMLLAAAALACQTLQVQAATAGENVECCTANTANCQACLQGQSVDEFCAAVHELECGGEVPYYDVQAGDFEQSCPESYMSCEEADPEIHGLPGYCHMEGCPLRGECCVADTASCQACALGISVEAYCADVQSLPCDLSGDTNCPQNFHTCHVPLSDDGNVEEAGVCTVVGCAVPATAAPVDSSAAIAGAVVGAFALLSMGGAGLYRFGCRQQGGDASTRATSMMPRRLSKARSNRIGTVALGKQGIRAPWSFECSLKPTLSHSPSHCILCKPCMWRNWAFA